MPRVNIYFQLSSMYTYKYMHMCMCVCVFVCIETGFTLDVIQICTLILQHKSFTLQLDLCGHANICMYVLTSIFGVCACICIQINSSVRAGVCVCAPSICVSVTARCTLSLPFWQSNLVVVIIAVVLAAVLF